MFGPSSLLVRQLQTSPGDQQSWNTFVQRYGPVIHRWCLHRGLQPDDAADITQSVFHRLVTHLEDFDRSIGRFRTWLLPIVLNCLKDRLKYHARRPTRTLSEAMAERLLWEDPGQELERRLTETFEWQLLQQAEALVRTRVHGETWDAYRLTRYEGWTARRVAQQLGMKVGTVSKQAYRVQNMVTKQVERLQADYE